MPTNTLKLYIYNAYKFTYPAYLQFLQYTHLAYLQCLQIH